MKTTDIVKAAILSEKAYKLMEKGCYTFLVDQRAKKDQIKKAVAKQFAIEVEKVNISKTAPKTKRIARGRKTTKVGGGKKATVWVKKGQSIASLLPKPKKTQTGKKAEKEVEKVSTEGREG